MRKVLVFLTSCLLLSIASSLADSNQTLQKMGSAHLCFTENKGQWNEDVKFRCDAGGAIVWICKDRIVYQFLRTVERAEADRLSRDDGNQGSVLHDPVDKFNQETDSIEQLVIIARFVNPNPDVQVVGEGMMEYRCNYFVGNDPSLWITDVLNYEAVTLRGIYAGVELRFARGESGTLTYEYRMEPGVDRSQIRVKYEVLDRARLSDDGRTIEETPWGEIAGLLRTPESVEDFVGLSSKKMSEDVGLNSMRFPSPSAMRLMYSTFLGGKSLDRSYAVAVDAMGNAYLTGLTWSANFPVQVPYDGTFGGTWDVFVSKLSVSGDELLYSTFLGGASDEWGMGIAVGSSGNAFVTGRTNFVDFPVQNPFDGSYNGGTDVFISELSSSGSALLYSTYLGGSDYDEGRAIAIDSSGNAIVTGWTQSTDFPVQNPYDGSFNGGSYDVFVSKISSAGSTMCYSTYLGGNDTDRGNGIAVDPSGNAYVVGVTWSSNIPIQNPYDESFNGGGYDAFVSKLSSVGDSLLYSTYLGGTSDDWGSKIAVNVSGGAYVTGGTSSPDFPLQNPYDMSVNGGLDVFISHLSPSGSTLLYSTYLGGSSNDEGFGVALDFAGNACVTGYTTSLDFPVKNSYSPGSNGSADVIVCKLVPSGNELLYSTYLGGLDVDLGYGIAVDAVGAAYVTGYTFSADFPVQSPYDGSLDGSNWDVFVSKLEFFCGDSNADNVTNISDAVLLINYIFGSGTAPNPLYAGDSNCSGSITISDAVYLINYIFSGGSAPCASCP